jgi:RNA recognition motif-containing protein
MNTAISRKQSESTPILVGNLAENTREEDIRSLFGQYGSVLSLWVIPGVPNRRGEDCCYLKMRDRQAKAAIVALDGKAFMGSILRVGEAHLQPGASSKPRRTAEDEQTRGRIRAVYEVVSVEKAVMPAGTEGDDWYRYVLSSGRSRITGFRRGSRGEVMAYASQCVEEFNLRSERGKSARPMAPVKKK